jgi:hypothetical protein
VRILASASVAFRPTAAVQMPDLALIETKRITECQADAKDVEILIFPNSYSDGKWLKVTKEKKN